MYRLKNRAVEPGKQLSDRVEIRRVGCMGLCGHGPLVGVEPDGVMYERVTPESASTIVDTLVGGITQVPRCDPKQPFFAPGEGPSSITIRLIRTV